MTQTQTRAAAAGMDERWASGRASGSCVGTPATAPTTWSHDGKARKVSTQRQCAAAGLRHSARHGNPNRSQNL